MEKLIELLNEYNGQDSYWLDEDSISKEKYINRGDGCQCFINEHIISKRYGFIKRLVENDKIDLDRILKEDGVFRKKFYDLEFARIEDRLLMLLAISDSPIQDLCVWLK